MGILPWLVAGLLAPAALASLPPPWVSLLLFLLAIAGLRFPRLRFAALSVLALAWSLHLYAEQQRARFAPGEAFVEMFLEGQVIGLPERRDDLLSFVLRTRGLPGSKGRPQRVLVRWYRDAPPVAAGETWRLQLRLSPPRGRVNFSGPDSERWYFTTGIAALAVVATGSNQRLAGPRGLHGWRGATETRLETLLAGREGAGLVLALAVAAREALDPGLVDAMRETGTAHLLAISGLNVGLVAGFSLLVLRWPLGLLGALCRWRRPGLVVAVCSLLLAAVYAALAGFATPTRRALIMLAVPLCCLLTRRSLSPWALWLAAMALVLIIDPLAALSEGFWLSFLAVAILLATLLPRHPRPGGTRALGLTQCGVSLAMLPLGLGFFGTLAPLGLLVNLAAIPWFSFLTLPFTLAGLLLAVPVPGMAEVLLDMAARSGAWAAHVIQWCAQLSTAWPGVSTAPGRLTLLFALCGALALLGPRGVPLRWLGAGFVLALFVPAAPRIAEGALRLELLDVGQGQAVILGTRHHALVYDTGPGIPGYWDLAGRVVPPALRSLGMPAPDRILVSHGDLDHAGGLDALRARFPRAEVHASLAELPAHTGACNEQLGWLWDEVSFQVLHPGPYLPYRGNQSSCVLSVTTAGGSVLLPGDIDQAVERRLARLSSRGHTVVVVPHHGSRTSSSGDWLEWTRPGHALVSAGAGNRFGFPHPEVVERHRLRAIDLWSTADCGALRVDLGRDGSLQTASARRVRDRPWRWPAAASCP